jgi:hypothetical protein
MRFSEAGREFQLLWRHQVPSFSGSPSAFFRSLKANPAAMNAVRRMLNPPAGESDEVLLEKLARMVESGRILVGMHQSNYGGIIAGADEAAPPENRPAADQSAGPAAVEEEPTFPPNHDQLAQAAALRQAARAGAPFCEECEKAKRAPAPLPRVAPPPAEPTFSQPVDAAVQVETLSWAAQSGVPFCEVCEQQSRGAA